jgi:RNA polymerase sigma-70 factor (ECF subfamily)
LGTLEQDVPSLQEDTYLRAIPALRRFHGDAPVRTRLLAIARRVCAAEIKNRERARQASRPP